MNKPAFPGKICIGHNKDSRGHEQPIYQHPRGMTIRQWYKGMALSTFRWSPQDKPEFFAKEAGKMADALLKEDEAHEKGGE